MTGPKLGPLDFAAITFYFVAVICVGIYAMCRSRRNTVSGYFLAGRFMTWLPVGASLFASNIGSEHFIGLAGSGAASGIAVGAFELNACFLLQFLGWVFLPVYIASGVCTLPEYIKKRFGGNRIRIYLSVLSLTLYIFTKISVNLYSGALFIQQALDWNLYISVLLLLALTGLTTITGGLAAVIYTDTLQAFVMVIGAAVLTVIGFIKVGGYSELYRLYMLAIPSITPASNYLGGFDSTNLSSGGNFSNYTDVLISALRTTLTTVYENVSGNDDGNISTMPQSLATSDITLLETSTNRSLATAIHECGRPRPDSWYMLRDASDPDMPWPGFLLGQTTASIWYWCADQMIVQRTLAAKSLSHAQGSTLFAGFLKTLPVFILVMPGMISRVLFPDEVACVDPDVCMKVCHNRLGCSNIAFPKLVLEIMPSGMKGIMMSVMLAALVSDLTSIFNSASTLFTMDVYRSLRHTARNRELMIVGRVFVGLMVVVGILWIPIVQNMQGAQLFIYIQSVSAYLSPPIAAVYLLAVLWKRANEKGAFYALMIGLLLGSARMTLSFVYPDPVCGQLDDRPWIVTGLHYMYFAFILFVVTSLVVIIVSLLSEKPTENQIAQTTYWTRFQLPITGNGNGIAIVSEDRILPNGKSMPLEGSGDDANSLLNVQANEKDLVVVFSSPDTFLKVGIEEIDLTVEKKMTTNEQNPATLEDEKTAKNDQSKRGCSSLVAKGVSWFCGLGSEGEDQRSADIRLRAEEICSLKQTKKEKRLLTIFLFLLLILDILLYIFFSTGSDFWLLRSSAGETKSSNQ